MAIRKISSGIIADNAVTTAKIADSTGASDGVTTAKIATDAVTAAKIPTGAVDADIGVGAVDTAELADNAVSLAKMAGGTDGQILTYNASGDPVAVGPGTDGQVLTSTGAGSPPAFEALPASGVDGISTSADATAITIGADESVTLSGDFVPATPMSHRNMIINGAMQVAQRVDEKVGGILQQGYTTVDGWKITHVGADNDITASREDLSSSDTGPWAKGFRNAYKLINGDQSSGAGAGDYSVIEYRLEAQDVSNSGWDYTNTSSKITLSFWIKSSVAQTFYGHLVTTDGTSYNYPFSLGSLSANTWTKVTKTIPGHASLQFDNNINEGLRIAIAPFYGTDFTDPGATLDTWAAYASGTRTPDNTSTWWTTDDATFHLTGIQLELGSSVTPFEHRSYADELLRCQRYYQFSHNEHASYRPFAHGHAYSATEIRCGITHNPRMRTAPTLVVSDSTSHFRMKAAGAQQDLDTCALQQSGPSFSQINATLGTSIAGGVGIGVELGRSDSSAYLAWSAEL